METRFPEVETSDIAREGTAAHALADALLTGSLTADTLRSMKDQVHDNGAVVDDAMIDGVLFYADFCRKALAAMQPDADAYGEHFVTASRLHPAISGTSDYSILNPRKIHVIDYKHGFDAVEAEGNFQLITYLAGLMDGYITHEPDRYVFDRMEVELTIVQPRAPH